jgi:serine/threonine-protein kinase
VLFEMLSGKRAFAGETVTDVLSAIISREPDWSELGADVPSAVTVLLHRCLEKDPRKRLRDIGEARLLLETSQAIDGNRRRTDTPTRTPTPRRWVVPALSAAVVALMLTNAYLWWSRTPRPLASTPLITPFDIQPPDAAATLTLTFRPAVAIAANGGAVAFVAASGGIDRVYVRARSEAVAHVIPGSDRGTNPEVSPDGKWVVFVADGAIRKAPIDGEATTIAQAADVRGMSWSDAGTLFLTLDAAAPLVAMSAAGSGVREITTLAAGERTHRWPQALPGGRHVLFTVGALTSPDNYDDASIDAVDVATGERTVVLKGAAMARYCGERQLLYSKGTEVYAIAFDPDRLATTGDAKQVLQAAARDASTGPSHFSCSHEGALAFVPGSSTSDLRNLVWVGNSGQSEVLKLQPGSYQAIRISPDGLRVAMLGGSNGRGDIWVYEFEHGSMNRVTFNGTNAAPTWSPDGSTVYYSSFDRSGNESTLLKKPLDGSRDAVTLAKVAARAYITKIEPGEQTAIVEAVFPPLDRGDILRVSFGSTAPPEKIVATPANEYAATVSPSGKWLAYQSDETGRAEVFIRDLAGSGARWQVTAAGGEEPLWSSDGRQLFYRTANRLFAMPVEPGNTFRHGPVKGLFDGVFTTGVESGRSYEFDAASARFLLVKPADPGPPPRAVRVVLNWAVAQR